MKTSICFSPIALVFGIFSVSSWLRSEVSGWFFLWWSRVSVFWRGMIFGIWFWSEFWNFGIGGWGRIWCFLGVFWVWWLRCYGWIRVLRRSCFWEVTSTLIDSTFFSSSTNSSWTDYKSPTATHSFYPLTESYWYSSPQMSWKPTISTDLSLSLSSTFSASTSTVSWSKTPIFYASTIYGWDLSWTTRGSRLAGWTAAQKFWIFFSSTT